MLDAYVGDYLREEIAAQALTRNIPAFGRFLESAAFSNGEIVSFQNIAADCGVSAPTVKSYFEILEDTLIGRFVPAHRKRPKRRVIQSPRFYLFDVGLANCLLQRGPIVQTKQSLVVSLDPRPRVVNAIHILPWETFLQQLWSGQIIH